MNPRCNLTDEEREEIFRRFDGQLTAEEESAARWFFPQYLFFTNEYPMDPMGWVPSDPVRVCTCTACGQSFSAVRGNYKRGKLHDEKCNCPQCGAEVTGKAVRKFRYDMTTLDRWIHAATVRTGEDGALLIEGGNVRRFFNHDNLTGDIRFYPEKRFYLAPGKVQMWTLDSFYGFGDECERRWVPRQTVCEPINPNYMSNWNDYGDYVMLNLGETLSRSGFKYCQIEKYFAEEHNQSIADNEYCRYGVKYLAWYSLHPQIEMAVKLGLSGAVRKLITQGKKNARLLDWDAKRAADFLRMSGTDARDFLKAGLTFKDLQDWRELGGKMPIRKWVEICRRAGDDKTVRELAGAAHEAGVDFERALRYTEGMLPECPRYSLPLVEIIKRWRDYLGMAKRLGYDMSEETVLMPRDLQARHEAAADIIRHAASEAERKKYKKRRKQLEKQFGFSIDGFSILVPKGSEEIVQEGKTLHHCVGGYAARHLSGAVTILFMRKSRKPGRSFLTIELEQDRGRWRIRQVHGYKNEGYKTGAVRPATKYKWFFDSWLSWVNAGSQRDESGQPVLPGRRKTA